MIVTWFSEVVQRAEMELHGEKLKIMQFLAVPTPGFSAGDKVTCVHGRCV